MQCNVYKKTMHLTCCLFVYIHFNIKEKLKVASYSCVKQKLTLHSVL